MTLSPETKAFIFDAIDKVYSYSGVGGNLHILVDDGNIDLRDLQFCAEAIEKNPHHTGDHTQAALAAERHCLNLFTRLSKTQRKKVLEEYGTAKTMPASPPPVEDPLSPLLPILHSQIDRLKPKAALMIFVGCEIGPSVQYFVNRLTVAQTNQLAFTLITNNAAQQEAQGTSPAEAQEVRTHTGEPSTEGEGGTVTGDPEGSRFTVVEGGEG